MDFKWYAWDPENNPHQKLLIEKYVKEANGEYKKDSAGNLIDNPMYDASIDPKTGTKKQLVWFDLKPFDEEPIFIDNKYETFANWSKHPKWNEEIDEEYYADTKLPYKSRTLFRPGWDEDKPSGFIAEAVVLGKGGLKQVIGETENFTLFKLEKTKAHNNKYLLKYSNTNTINSIDQIKETGESSYFSTSGIWLFVSNAPNSISNFKLILIQEPGEKNSDSKNPPNSYFTDNVVLDSGQIQPLWKTTTGASFYNYLISVGLTDKEIYKLNYEDAMEYYKGYIERLYYRDYFNSYISIAPTLKTIADDKFSVDEFANRYKNTKLAEVELLSDFTNKDKVNINKVEINPDKSGAFIYFNLNTVEEIYMLNQNPIFMKIKFKDIKPTNNQIINLELNRQYFIDTAKHNYIKDFMTQIWQNKKSWFNGLTDEEFNKLNFTTDFSYLTKLLTIKVELVKPDSNIAIMPYKIFSIPLNVFKISEIDNFDEDKKKNPNHNSANDEDEPNKSQTKANIFANITLKTIELNGLNDVNEIKNFIISEIKKQIQGLELDKDYQIKNLDSVAFEMSLPQIRPSDNKYIHNAILVIEAINGRGILYGKVNNVVFHVFEHEINLKEIEIPDFSFEAGNLSEIREKITRYTYEKLLQRGLILGQDVEISNLENAVRNLAKGKGFKQAVVIKGINRKVVNLTSYNAINNAKIVVDDNGKQFLFDLMSIKTKKFSYKENVLSKLRDKVITDINEYLQKTYDIKYGIDWDLDLNELNNSLRLLTNEKNILKSIQIKIRPIAGSSKNAAEFTIENILNSSVIDDLDDVVVELPNNNDDIQKQKAKNKKLLISILAPLGLITLGISIALGWFIKVRYFDKKIK
ncbi:hypothetical protein KQ872_01615 [Mycoplasma sp. ES3225-GEN-MYC]|nr:hypothetical protein [Mycoplasma miroungigenitalium]MBU4691658.1 hypothetical protein [Mycoplasma miroungigenitalium]